MKIIGISGSPRKGNTEWMLRQVLDTAVKNGADAELLLLRKMDVKMCRGCLICETGGKDRKGICSIKDDMNGIYPHLIEADAIVLGTPTYFELISGLLKNFIDRTCPIWPRFEGKVMAGLAVAEEGTGAAIANLKTYASVCKMQWSGSVTFLAKNPGDAARDKAIGKKLRRLALQIIRKYESLNTSLD